VVLHGERAATQQLRQDWLARRIKNADLHSVAFKKKLTQLDVRECHANSKISLKENKGIGKFYE
jgi:hypothetical protein